jgi:hypothetical protein
MYLPQRVDRTIKRVGAMTHLEVMVQCNGNVKDNNARLSAAT